MCDSMETLSDRVSVTERAERVEGELEQSREKEQMERKKDDNIEGRVATDDPQLARLARKKRKNIAMHFYIRFEI